MELVFWICFLIGLSIAVGFWAKSKGLNPYDWGALSLLISPLLAGIILFLLSKSDEKKAQAEQKAREELAATENRCLRAVEELEIRQMTVGAVEFAAELERLFSLKENELLTEEEYDNRKRDCIFQLAKKKPRESTPEFLSALIPLVQRAALTLDEIAEIKKYML